MPQYTDTFFMMRCLQLAALGRPYVAGNPMVGAVLVYKNKIIGEGYHRIYGGPHAEVNCIESVVEEDIPLIAKSVLYVSLEPCAHHGKTPPCADFVISSGIQKVVIGSRDPFSAVNGKGIEKLQAAGIEVICGVLEEQCRYLNRRFFFFHEAKKPWLLLKWAQTADGFLDNMHSKRLHISNEVANRMVHKMRASQMAILVGANTVMQDDPLLTNRLYFGPSPIILIIDPKLRVPLNKKVFREDGKIVIFNRTKEGRFDNLTYVLMRDEAQLTIDEYCYANNIVSVLVEGGAFTLERFIAHRWNEAVCISNTKLTAKEGVRAPVLKAAVVMDNFSIEDNEISVFRSADPFC